VTDSGELSLSEKASVTRAKATTEANLC
jgi:hypothetical protein